MAYWFMTINLFHLFKYFCWWNQLTTIKYKAELLCLCSFFCVFALKENVQGKCDDLFDTYTTSLHYKQKTRCHYVNQQIRVWGWPDRGTSGMDHRRTSFSFSKMRLSFYLKACIVFCYRIRSLWGAFVWQVSSSRASSCIQPVHIQNPEVKFNTLPTINIWFKQL